MSSTDHMIFSLNEKTNSYKFVIFIWVRGNYAVKKFWNWFISDGWISSKKTWIRICGNRIIDVIKYSSVIL